MKAFAPGKVLLSGAYAVLHGAPAVVLAVSRGAVADTELPATHVSDELRAALASLASLASPEGGARAPHVSVAALFQGELKLGLGASAAGVVAALGALAAARGEDLASDDVRASIFRAARAGHASAQSGGSGVDVAASVHGGLLGYTLVGDAPSIEKLALPTGLTIEAFFSGSSASTRELRARVDALSARSPSSFAVLMADLARDSVTARDALLRGDLGAFVGAVRAQLAGLASLGREADAPIVLPSFLSLDALARETEGVFTGSGAGGGDVALYLGPRASSAALRQRASELSFTSVDLGHDLLGLRVIA